LRSLGLVKAQHKKCGAVTSISGDVETLIGGKAYDLEAAGLNERVHLQDRVTFLKCVQDAAHTGTIEKCEFRFRSKVDDSSVWRVLHMVACPSEHFGAIRGGVTTILRDMTEARDLKNELGEAQMRLETFSNSKKQFVRTVSHELRTPLNAIIGFSDVLQQEIFGPMSNERQYEHVSYIQEAGEHLLCVVNKMLEFSSIEAGRYELDSKPLKLAHIIANCITMLEPMSKKAGLSIVADIPDSLHDVRGDENAIRQIVINLLSNAVKFSNAESNVEITVKPLGPSFQIVVIDTGIGISEEFFQRIGKPFEQADQGADRQYEGTGLGLSVVQGFVDLHKGNLEFDSKEGVGTTVTVTLPKQVRAPAPVPGEEAVKFIRRTDLRTQPSESQVSKNSKSNNVTIAKGADHARLSA